MPEGAEAKQLEALHKLYVKAHIQLQNAGTRILQLEERVAELEKQIAAQKDTPQYSYGVPNDN